jgi:hypothetical protein
VADKNTPPDWFALTPEQLAYINSRTVDQGGLIPDFIFGGSMVKLLEHPIERMLKGDKTPKTS